MSEKISCEKCAEPLATGAFACGHGCTFCTACTQAMAHACPNCGGRLEPVLRVVTP